MPQSIYIIYNAILHVYTDFSTKPVTSAVTKLTNLFFSDNTSLVLWYYGIMCWYGKAQNMMAVTEIHNINNH